MAASNSGFLTSLLSTHGYVVLFAACIIEGPFVTMSAGFLASIGYFHLLPVFLICWVGNVLGDSLHYTIGALARPLFVARYVAKLGIQPKGFEAMKAFVRDHPFRTLLTVKLVPPITSPGMLIAGATPMRLKHFISFIACMSFVYAGLFAFLGYFFGYMLSRLSAYFEVGQVILAVLAVVVIFVWYMGQRAKAAVLSKF